MLRLSADRAGRQRVSIFDARGRLVRAFAPSDETAGERNLWWDGRDQAGQAVVAGQYSVVVRLGERRASGHITLLH
jgi:flagellar hook assembly protein FlgD